MVFQLDAVNVRPTSFLLHVLRMETVYCVTVWLPDCQLAPAVCTMETDEALQVPGADVGAEVGVAVGAIGAVVGLGVGAVVGLVVGAAVAGVGLVVGAVVGFVVGAVEGAEVDLVVGVVVLGDEEGTNETSSIQIKPPEGVSMLD
jgi:hypothetical protein